MGSYIVHGRTHNLWCSSCVYHHNPLIELPAGRVSVLCLKSFHSLCIHICVPTALPQASRLEILSPPKLPLCLKRLRIPWTSSVACNSHIQRETSIHSALQRSSWLILSKMTKSQQGSWKRCTLYSLTPLISLFIDYILSCILISLSF